MSLLSREDQFNLGVELSKKLLSEVQKYSVRDWSEVTYLVANETWVVRIEFWLPIAEKETFLLECGVPIYSEDQPNVYIRPTRNEYRSPCGGVDSFLSEGKIKQWVDVLTDWITKGV